MVTLRGIITALITPFSQSGSIDFSMNRQIIDYVVGKGVNGLFSCGTTGEAFLMTLEERKNLAEQTVVTAAGRVPVFVHVGAATTRDAVSLAEHAWKSGADGIASVTPFYFKVTDAEMVEYFIALSRSVPDDFPLYFYNIPQLAGNDLSPEVIRKILDETANIVGIKYSFPDFNRLREYLQIGLGEFKVLTGSDNLLFSALNLGCGGTVSGVANVYPEPFGEVYRAFLAGEKEKAMEAQKAGADIASILKNGENIAYFKAALEYKDICRCHMRKPLCDLEGDEKETFFVQLRQWEAGTGKAF